MSSSSSGGSSGSGSKKGAGRQGGFGVGSGVGELDEYFVEQLVNDVTSHFELRSSLTLTSDARSAVLEPAIRNRAHIFAELNSGAVVPEQIQDAVRTLLANAERIAREREEQTIDELLIRIAMKLECRYFPWC